MAIFHSGTTPSRIALFRSEGLTQRTLCAIAQEMRTSSPIAASLLAPLEVMGVESLTATAMTIRVRLKTVPLKQWDAAREFRRRLKKAFDAEGVGAPT